MIVRVKDGQKLVVADVTPKHIEPDLKQLRSDFDVHSHNYEDLINKPTIPKEQIQSDWNEKNINSKAYILNKPESFVAGDIRDANLTGQQAQFGQQAQHGNAITYARSDHYHELPIVTSQETYPLQRPAIVVSGTIQINNTSGLGFPINLTRIGNTVIAHGGMTGNNSLNTNAHICYIPVGFRPDPNDQYAFCEFPIVNGAGGGQIVTVVKLRHNENRIPEQQWELYVSRGQISKSSPLGLYATWNTVEADPLRPPLEPEPVWPFGVIVPSLEIAYSIDKSCRHIGMHVTVQDDESYYDCSRVYWFKNGIENEDLIPKYYSGMIVPDLNAAYDIEHSSREIGMKVIIQDDGTDYGSPREYQFRDGTANENLIPYLKYLEDAITDLLSRVIKLEAFRAAVDNGTYDIPTQLIV